MKNKLLLSLLTLILIGCGGGGGGGGDGTPTDPLSITTSNYTLSGTVPTVAAVVPIEILVDGTSIDAISIDATGSSTWAATVAGPGTYTVTLSINGVEEVVKTVIISEN